MAASENPTRQNRPPEGFRACRRCGDLVPDDDAAEREHWQRRSADSDARWTDAAIPQPRRTASRPLDGVPGWARIPW